MKERWQQKNKLTKCEYISYLPLKGLKGQKLIRITTGFFWRSTLMLLLSATIGAKGADVVFSVQGNCRYPRFTESPNPTPVDCPFTITVSNCLWFLEMSDIQSNRQVGYWEISYDGRYTYYMQFQGEWEKNAEAYRGTGKFENVAVGIVAPHEVPHFPFAHQAAIIWLTYASACYLSGHSSGDSIQPAASVGVGSHGVNQSSFFTEVARWTCDANSPKLPIKVSYLDNGIIGWNGRQPDRWPKPIDNGFTNTVFETLEQTNLGPITLPVTARMTTFSPAWPEVGGQRVLEMQTYKYELKATNFTLGLLHSGIFQPRVPGNMRVDDQRFTTREANLGFGYDDNVGKWLTDKEAKALPEYQRAAAQVPSKVARWVVWTILLVLVALPMAVLWRKKSL